MKDLFSEIWNSVRNNKLRTALTGFAVSWGIFLLICLLGAGNGIINTFQGSSDRYVQNSMMVGGSMTSLPYAGYQPGRWITLDNGDYDITVGKEFSDRVEIAAPVTQANYNQLFYNGKSCLTGMSGVVPDYLKAEKVLMAKGRFINEKDVKERRKVVVLETAHEKELSADLIGKWIKFQDVSFYVVGIAHTNESSWRPRAYVPYTTMKGIFTPGPDLGTISLTFKVNNMKESDAFENDYLARLKSHHQIHPDDQGGVWAWNRYSQNNQIHQGQRLLSIGMWILGILTLISGIVGVSNIMLISVKERTHEFGIRKAIGAKPHNILALIITESVTITAVFGYLGMAIGMLACEIMDKTLGSKTMDLGFDSIRMMVDPYVGLDVAVEATLLLIVAGTLAGLAPAWKASKVKPIEALRAE